MRRVARSLFRGSRYSRSAITLAFFLAATFGAPGAPLAVAATLLPPAPTNVSAAPSTVGRMTLVWRPPVTTIALTGYQYRSATTTNSGASWSGYSASVPLTSSTGRQAVPCAATPTAGGGCRYQVAALSSNGAGAWSLPGSALWAPPSAPRTPSVVGRLGAHVANVVWKLPLLTGGVPISDILAQVSSDAGATWSSKIESLYPAYISSAFVLPQGCETNSECRVRLYAANAVGRSTPTSPMQVEWRSGSADIGVSTGTPYVPTGMTETQFWNRVAATGSGWARVDCSPSSYTNYTNCDNRVSEIRRVGMRAILTLTYRPSNSPDVFTTSEHQQWAVWAGEVAARLTLNNPGTIGAFEIWNEPNNPLFWSPVDPVAYADLLARSAFAIRARSAVPILTGGLSPGGTNGASGSTSDPRNPATWLAAVYAAGGRSTFDAVAAHPYDSVSKVANQGPPLVTWSSGFRSTHWLRVVMDAHGDSAKRIWGTEAGTPSCTSYSGGKLSEGARAVRLRDDIADWRRGLHNPWSGETIDFGLKSDWNTGPFMVFKMYKQYDAPGLGLSFASSQCGRPAWYEPAPVAMLRSLTSG